MKPRVSFVYLTKNGGALLKESIQSVLLQEADFPYEIVAVDSGSTDGTLEYLKNSYIIVHSIPAHEFNFGLTRDLGFELAQGDIVIPISQDVILVGKDWLRKIVEPFSDVEVALVQGSDVQNPLVEIFYWDKIHLFYYTRDVKKWMAAYNNIGVSFTTCAIRRTVWEDNRLGRVEMSEDKVFQQKITFKGHKIVRLTEVLDCHSHTYTVATLAKRCENEGLGWRNVGIRYSLHDMLMDIVHPPVMRALLHGIFSVKIKKTAELLFPLIRPLFLYKGNNFSTKFVR